MPPPASVDAYIASFPAPVAKRLIQIRKLVRKLVPEAEEVISYSMPAFKYKGLLIWYAAYEHHIGLYPKASGIEKFKKELKPYKFAKGSVQFRHEEPLPAELISRIIQFRMEENSTSKIK